MKAAILALIIGGLVLGTAAAGPVVVNPDAIQIVPYSNWAIWVSDNLTTPAYASGWGAAFANATNVDPQTNMKSIGQPYAVTAVIVGSGDFDTFVTNTRVDPSAGLNLTVQSLAALADNATGAIVVSGMPSTHFVSYAAAIGNALETSDAIRSSVTVGAFNTSAIANPLVASSYTNGFATAIADYTV